VSALSSRRGRGRTIFATVASKRPQGSRRVSTTANGIPTTCSPGSTRNAQRAAKTIHQADQIDRARIPEQTGARIPRKLHANTYGDGGWGGAIQLVAGQTLIIQATGVVAAAGGGEAGGGSDGANATSDAAAAVGAGGGSAAGSAAAGVDGADGTKSANNIGGGGGAGGIRLNSTGGAATITGVLSPPLTSACVSQGSLTP
jgi:hypothetical protein